MNSKFTLQVLFLKKFLEDVFLQTQEEGLLKWKMRGQPRMRAVQAAEQQPRAGGKGGPGRNR